MNRAILAGAATALILISSTAFAQSAPAVAPSGPAPAGPAPAVPTLPLTENSAKAQIEASGFTDVKSLSKQADGSWRAKATKNNAEVALAVDANGNVTQMAQ